jgi:hypothetical protein
LTTEEAGAGEEMAGGTAAPPLMGGTAPKENLSVEEGPMRSRRRRSGSGVGSRRGGEPGKWLPPRLRLLALPLLPLLLIPMAILLLPLLWLLLLWSRLVTSRDHPVNRIVSYRDPRSCGCGDDDDDETRG